MLVTSCLELAPLSSTEKAKEIGERIRVAYTRAGHNRSQFTRLVGVNYTTVIHWEKGTKTPSGDNLQAMATTLGTTVDWILNGDAKTSASHSPQPGYQKAAESAWHEFLRTDANLVKLFSPQELAEIRDIRFRSGAPSSASFYRHIAMAKLDHRSGADIVEALDAEDVTPKHKRGESLALDRSKHTKNRR
jgi:transcriptional regulator with XRE-family HTH domain